MRATFAPWADRPMACAASSSQERLRRRRRRHAQGAQAGRVPILSVTENGFGKRTNVEEYRLQSRGGKGVKNVAVTPRIGRVNTIQLVDDTSGPDGYGQGVRQDHPRRYQEP